VSSQPRRTRLAEVARLVREAEAAESQGRPLEAARLLEEVARLDPGDKRALHRLGDLYGIRLKRPGEAARWYAAEARAEERDEFQARALALWRLVVRCDADQLEAHERIGALCVALGRVADARAHYDATAGLMERAGRRREAAILRAHLAALADFGAARPDPSPRRVEPGASPTSTADDNAASLAADRLQNGRLYHYYGLHAQARTELEGLLASLPDHVEARRLLVEVCRALEDTDAAAEHMRVLTRLMRAQGVATVPLAPGASADELPIEEWVGMEEAPPADPMAELLEEIRADVERVVEGLHRKAGER
jgi:tetratricopeptide (TPR) repeat protein